MGRLEIAGSFLIGPGRSGCFRAQSNECWKLTTNGTVNLHSIAVAKCLGGSGSSSASTRIWPTIDLREAGTSTQIRSRVLGQQLVFYDKQGIQCSGSRTRQKHLDGDRTVTVGTTFGASSPLTGGRSYDVLARLIVETRADATGSAKASATLHADAVWTSVSRAG